MKTRKFENIKNPLLSRLGTLDVLYPTAVRFPKLLKESVAATIPVYLNSVGKKQKMLDRLTVIVTDVCNLACSHCFISTSEREKHPWEMSLENYEELFRSVENRIAQAHFTGGETTVRPDFPEIAIAAANFGKISNSTILTNGLQPKRILGQLQKILDGCKMNISIQLSIDGIEEKHDIMRRRSGAFAKTIDTMDCLSYLKKDYPNQLKTLSVNTVITKDNLLELDQIIDVVRACDFSHTFTFVRDSRIHAFNLPAGEEPTEYNPVDFSSYLTNNDMEHALKTLHEKLWDNDPGNMFHAINRVVLETAFGNLKAQANKANVKCYSGYSSLILFPNGDIAECEFLRRFTNMANHEWRLDKLLDSSIYKSHMSRGRQCWCSHECSVGLSLMYHPNLVRDLLDGASG